MNHSGWIWCLCWKECHTNCHTFVLQFFKAVILDSWNNVVNITEAQRFCGWANGWKDSKCSGWYRWRSGQKIDRKGFWQGDLLSSLCTEQFPVPLPCTLSPSKWIKYFWMLMLMWAKILFFFKSLFCINNLYAHINNYCGSIKCLSLTSKDKILTLESWSSLSVGVYAHLLHYETFK